LPGFYSFHVSRRLPAQLLQSYVYCELASFHSEIVERDKDLPTPWRLRVVTMTLAWLHGYVESMAAQ
jgi:hypothetical protein